MCYAVKSLFKEISFIELVMYKQGIAIGHFSKEGVWSYQHMLNMVFLGLYDLNSDLRIPAIHGAKTTKNQTPLVHFARLFYNQTVFKKIERSFFALLLHLVH